MSTDKRIVTNLNQLEEALRVARQMDGELMRRSPDGTDSVQIHLLEPEEGMLRVELWSNEHGQPVRSYEVDLGAAPGETGVAIEVVNDAA